MNVATFLRSQLSASSTVLEALLADQLAAESHRITFDYLAQLATCFSVIENRREHSIFQHALKEYQFAQLALACGLYRQAFTSLRLALELALSAVDFSVNEVRLRSWLVGESDIVWARLIEKDNGLLSPSFVRIFYDGLKDHGQSHRAMAEKVYRECSEYVHGNASTHHNLPNAIEYSQQIVLSWCEKADTIRRIVIFAFVVRYMSDLDATKIDVVRPILLEVLGHIDTLRTDLGGTAGG